MARTGRGNASYIPILDFEAVSDRAMRPTPFRIVPLIFESCAVDVRNVVIYKIDVAESWRDASRRRLGIDVVGSIPVFESRKLILPS